MNAWMPACLVALAVAGGLLLVACSTHPPAENSGEWIERKARILAEDFSDKTKDQWDRSFGREVAEWGNERVLRLDDGDWRFRPYLQHDPAMPTYGHFIPHQGGGHHFRHLEPGSENRWVVEAVIVSNGKHRVLAGAATPEVAEVRIPRADGTFHTVVPEDTGLGFDFFVAVLDDELDPGHVLGLGAPWANEVAGYDADGVKLGNQHYKVSPGDEPHFGPYDGTLDREWYPEHAEGYQ